MIPFVALAYQDPLAFSMKSSFENHVFQRHDILVVALVQCVPDPFNRPFERGKGFVSQIVIRMREGFHHLTIVSCEIVVCVPHCRAICVCVETYDDLAALVSTLRTGPLQRARPFTQESCRLESGYSVYRRSEREYSFRSVRAASLGIPRPTIIIRPQQTMASDMSIPNGSKFLQRPRQLILIQIRSMVVNILTVRHNSP